MNLYALTWQKGSWSEKGILFILSLFHIQSYECNVYKSKIPPFQIRKIPIIIGEKVPIFRFETMYIVVILKLKLYT